MCVAILKHLEAQILQHTQEQDLLVFLKVQFTCCTIKKFSRKEFRQDIYFWEKELIVGLQICIR